jgi:hypothetical protein
MTVFIGTGLAVCVAVFVQSRWFLRRLEGERIIHETMEE